MCHTDLLQQVSNKKPTGRKSVSSVRSTQAYRPTNRATHENCSDLESCTVEGSASLSLTRDDHRSENNPIQYVAAVQAKLFVYFDESCSSESESV